VKKCQVSLADTISPELLHNLRYSIQHLSPCCTPIIDVEIVFITFEEGLFEVLKGLFTLSSTK
jgi:hypothetical protein